MTNIDEGAGIVQFCLEVLFAAVPTEREIVQILTTINGITKLVIRHK